MTGLSNVSHIQTGEVLIHWLNYLQWYGTTIMIYGLIAPMNLYLNGCACINSITCTFLNDNILGCLFKRALNFQCVTTWFRLVDTYIVGSQKVKANSHLQKQSAFSTVDCVNAEVEKFLSLCRNATVCCRYTQKMQ